MRERVISADELVTVLAKKFRSKAIQYDDLMAVIADVPTAETSTDLIPVTDQIPKSGERVIVCRKDGRVEQGIFLGVNGWWKVYGTNTKAVTHWMPMPEQPKGD